MEESNGRVNNGETVLTVLGVNSGMHMVSSTVNCEIFCDS